MRLRRRSEEPEDEGPEVPAEPVALSGLEEPDVIELIVEEPDGYIGLLMSETRPWGGGPVQAEQLLAKVRTYKAFATKGGLARQVPGSEGRSVRVVLNTAQTPGVEVLGALRAVEQDLASAGIDFEVRPADRPGF